MISNPPILTPDQRLRVFVSSTLQKLAEERVMVNQVIQNIHSTPIMIEMGASGGNNENNFLHAVTILAAVDHLRTTTHLQAWDDLEATLVDARQKLQANLDPSIFQKAWNEGVEMSLDEMVSFALET